MRGKYDTILGMLSKETQQYASQTGLLEDLSNKQQADLSVLQADYKEAAAYRDEMRDVARVLEKGLREEQRARDKEVEEARKVLQERKNILLTVTILRYRITCVQVDAFIMRSKGSEKHDTSSTSQTFSVERVTDDVSYLVGRA